MIMIHIAGRESKRSSERIVDYYINEMQRDSDAIIMFTGVEPPTTPAHGFVTVAEVNQYNARREDR